MGDSRFSAAIDLAISKGWIKEVDENPELEEFLVLIDKRGAEIDKLIERLKEANKAGNLWIPVVEMMPPDLPDYKIIVSDGKDSASIYSRTLYRDPQGNLRAPARYGRGIDVIWWMPWPELPSAKKPCDSCDNIGWETMGKVAACNCCEEHEFYTPKKRD
jgi:hypothetical protein